MLFLVFLALRFPATSLFSRMITMPRVVTWFAMPGVVPMRSVHPWPEMAVAGTPHDHADQTEEKADANQQRDKSEETHEREEVMMAHRPGVKRNRVSLGGSSAILRAAIGGDAESVSLCLSGLIGHEDAANHHSNQYDGCDNAENNRTSLRHSILQINLTFVKFLLISVWRAIMEVLWR
jgi:hypothetical protein